MGRPAATLGIALALALLAGPAPAEIYEWVDAQGRTRYTTDLHQVPPSQRPDAEAAAASRPTLIRTREPSRAPAARRPGPATGPAARAPAADGPGETVQGRDEAAWRAEHRRYRDRVARLESLRARLEALGADTAPGPRRAAVSRRNQARYEDRHAAWQQTGRDLEAARLQLERFEEKARRAGVPPGWLR
jgi:hypothetical protein